MNISNRPPPKTASAWRHAIAHDQIAWHALPFTWQTEMLDPSMIEGSLAISKSLDARFGRVTTGAKMTDVPGHTRGLISPLAKHSVKFLDIGVNDASAPAQLPPIFLWKDASGGASRSCIISATAESPVSPAPTGASAS